MLKDIRMEPHFVYAYSNETANRWLMKNNNVEQLN